MSNNNLSPQSDKSAKMSVKQLVFSAMAIALAITIATVIKLPSLPAGGSATLFSMLMIVLIGYWYGPKTGLTCSFAFGILQFISNPYILHPLQVLLDYPLAFGALGLSGFFHTKKRGLLIGYIVSVTGRFIFHSISGIIFYTEYVGNIGGNAAAIASGLIYNLSYILPEALATILLLSLKPVDKAMKRLKLLATS